MSIDIYNLAQPLSAALNGRYRPDRTDVRHASIRFGSVRYTEYTQMQGGLTLTIEGSAESPQLRVSCSWPAGELPNGQLHHAFPSDLAPFQRHVSWPVDTAALLDDLQANLLTAYEREFARQSLRLLDDMDAARRPLDQPRAVLRTVLLDQIDRALERGEEVTIDGMPWRLLRKGETFVAEDAEDDEDTIDAENRVWPVNEALEDGLYAGMERTRAGQPMSRLWGWQGDREDLAVLIGQQIENLSSSEREMLSVQLAGRVALKSLVRPR